MFGRTFALFEAVVLVPPQAASAAQGARRPTPLDFLDRKPPTKKDNTP